MIKARPGRLLFAVGTFVLTAGIASLAASSDISRLCEKLVTYEFGQDRTFIASLEHAVKKGDVPTRSEVEAGLIGVLKNPQSTLAARDYACRLLRDYGSVLAVPALEQLLNDPESAQLAVFALDGIPGISAAAALRRSLGNIAPASRAAALTALGRRHDAATVPLAADYANADQHAVAAAALFALGQIGTAASAEALLGMTIPPSLETDWQDACLCCAKLLLNAKDILSATAMYKRLFASGMPPHVRAAALGGLADLGSLEAIEPLLNMLRSDDIAQQQSAIAVLPRLCVSGSAKRLITELPTLRAPAQTAVVLAVAEAGDVSALTPMRHMLDHTEGALLVAIVNGLGALGNAEDVPALVKLAGTRGEAGRAAASTLVALKGDGVARVLLNTAETGDSSDRVAAIRALTERGAADMVAPLLQLATDDNAKVRREAIKALGELSKGDSLPRLIDLLVLRAASSDAVRLQGVVTTAAQKVGPKGRAVQLLLAKRNDIDETGLAAITRVLGRLGSDEGLAVVRNELAAGPVRREAAVRALADWPDTAPLEDLKRVAEVATSDLEHVLALRGYLRLLGLPNERSETETAEKLRTAMTLSRSANERKQVLGLAGGMNDGASLALAVSLMDDGDVGPDAVATVERILGNMRIGTLKLQRQLVKSLAGSSHETVAQKAKEILTSLDSPVYEAEEATTDRVSIDSNHKGFTGKGFVNFGAQSGSLIDWNIAVEKDGDYALTFRYALGGSGNRPIDILVDGNAIKHKQDFVGTGAWNAWKTVQLTAPLKAGEHVVRALTVGHEGPNIDSLNVQRLGE